MWNKVLVFLDLMNDKGDRLSWSNVGVAGTTLLNGFTATTTVLSMTDWKVLGVTGALHALTSIKREVKRRTEK